MKEIVKRPWGSYRVLTEGNGFLVKTIQVEPLQKLSVQLHNHRSEHWVILSGVASVLLGKETLELNAGDSIDIKCQEIHSLQNLNNEPLIVLEVQKGDILSEDDIVRYEDIYGRV